MLLTNITDLMVTETNIPANVLAPLWNLQTVSTAENQSMPQKLTFSGMRFVGKLNTEV